MHLLQNASNFPTGRDCTASTLHHRSMQYSEVVQLPAKLKTIRATAKERKGSSYIGANEN